MSLLVVPVAIMILEDGVWSDTVPDSLLLSCCSFRHDGWRYAQIGLCVGRGMQGPRPLSAEAETELSEGRSDGSRLDEL